MKQLNKKLRIVQKGGLMIEALAMLGLIAVVTPTMYKKSAERTLEVEDINTATTMRTYLNAAESYVNNNYANLIKQSEENKNITGELSNYLPYGYQDKSLYDFGVPKAFVHKQGMNLTAFVTFPAKAEGGLGKERTSRIASLIGSNGGYVTVDDSIPEEELEEGEERPNKARGVGGIWTLDRNNGYNDIVGDVHKNSIVMASSNIISDISSTELESEKYLSRIPEGAGHQPDYRNTMRTDIYMGGLSANETMAGLGYGKHSIRNIKSLIVGTDKLRKKKDPDSDETVVDESGLYGLYISGGENPREEGDGEEEEGNFNPNAFIYGTLEAAVESNVPMFKVDAGKMMFGMPRDDDENTRAFTVSQDGSIENYGSLDLAKDPANNEVKIGTLGGWEQAGNHSIRVNGSESENYYFHGRRLGSVPIATEVVSDQNVASIMNESRFAVGSDAVDLSDEYNISDMSGLKTHVMIEGGSKEEKGWSVVEKDAEGNITGTRSVEAGKIEYSNKTDIKFPVAVGSNMIVDGVLTARQMDAQHVRMATLSAGSTNIDDPESEKWMNVDADGVKIGKTVSNNHSNGAYFSDADIQIGTHWDSANGLDTDKGAYLRINAYGEEDDPEVQTVLTEDGDGANILMGNKAMQVEISDSSRIENANNSFGYGKVAITSKNQKGSVVVSDSNLTVMRQRVENDDGDAQQYPVFSVRGNATAPIGDAADNNVHGGARDYDVAVHGKMLMTGSKDDGLDNVRYLSVGKFSGIENDEGEAMVKIVPPSRVSNSVYVAPYNYTNENILTIAPKKLTAIRPTTSTSETGEYEDQTKNDGRIFMRKGLIEATNNQGDYKEELENASGVMMASRFVANNPNKKYSTDVQFVDKSGLSVAPQPGVSQMSSVEGRREAKNNYHNNYYDTYMVNPAYTSVMNDIKLASRGGARLSDILPDFITKGIYLVTNSNSEGNDDNEILTGSGSNSSYASAYGGYVGAPACPPGYARVITVNPITFPVLGGYVTKEKNNVSPSATVEVSVSGNEEEIEITLPDILSTQLFRIYAVKSKLNKDYKPVIQEDVNKVDSWGILMGYTSELNPNVNEPGRLTEDNKESISDGNGSSVFWNLIPVGKNTIESYATTYCYFDRVGVGDRVLGRPLDTDPNSAHNSLSIPEDISYKEGLNDPQLKYDEVW